MGELNSGGLRHKVGDVATDESVELPVAVDERQHGSTVSELGGGIGPEEVARDAAEMAREREVLPGQAEGSEEDESTGLGTGRRGMRRVNGKLLERASDYEWPSGLPESPPEGPHRHAESY